MEEIGNNLYRCSDGEIVYAPNYEAAKKKCKEDFEYREVSRSIDAAALDSRFEKFIEQLEYDIKIENHKNEERKLYSWNEKASEDRKKKMKPDIEEIIKEI